MSFLKTAILAAACLIIFVVSTESAFSMSGYDPSWKPRGGQNGGTHSVFEPSTALIVGSGIAGVAALRWIRSRKK